MSELIYWIWLSLACTAGSETFRKLLCKYSSAENVFRADNEELKACVGSKSKDLSAICDKRLEKASEVLHFVTSKNVGILTYEDSCFPSALREIPNPPVLLYYRGVLPDFNNECFISVVGTRKLTDYGRSNAFSIGQDLAKAGAVIVSGMAIGIDGVAMAGALSASAKTVAFLGCGIDICYPPSHLTLAREIVKNGCIMTEYAPKTSPDGFNFPVRNRLISGISCATVVIEGVGKSGSMITARHAKKQGKTVYALPGNVDNKTSAVSNTLIKNGAKLITDAFDIIRDMEFKYLGKINPFRAEEKIPGKAYDYLCKYKISCVTQSDSIFSHKTLSKVSKDATSEKNKINTILPSATITEDAVPKEKTISEAGFDKQTLEIYLKIPRDAEIPYSALIDDKHGMKDVMRALSRLELGSFIKIIPGEKVKRNL